MLKGNVRRQNISAEAYEAQKATIEQEALKRFLSASDKKKPSPRSKKEGLMLSTRQNIIEKYDSIAIERILGKSDLFPISYLEMGLKVSNAICRISIRNSKGNVVGYGTGFLIAPFTLMTNNHVIDSPESALHSIAEFNFQDDIHFMPCPTYNYRLDPDKLFITNEELDYTIVAVKDNKSSGRSLEDFGMIPLEPMAGKILTGEYVSIIQHPKGGPKSVTLRENQVSNILDHFIHYLTDTEPGSSGSPVFNDQWVLVALHHAGVPDPKKKGEWIANEGVRISSIVSDIAKQYPTLSDKQKFLIDSMLPNLIEPEPSSDPSVSAKGYDPQFLGKKYKVPMPKLNAAMEEDVSRLKDGSYVLDYVHFSIVMRRSRGLAYFTAVNIDGKNQVRIPRTADSWKFDPRIDKKNQYGNEVYSQNDLDRGHLVRRNDPNWGEDAELANEDTFHFTNSAPQHKNLNQKIWVGLEDYITQNARAHNLRVTVFTGPVFRDDDLVYRKKYQIPAEFWKVVVIVKPDRELSATAYLQTQKNMIENLEFAYGEYETYQIPIAKIEQITGLDFGELSNYDPIANIESAGLQIQDHRDIKL